MNEIIEKEPIICKPDWKFDHIKFCTNSQCEDSENCKDNWFNCTFDGRMHKALMAMERKIGVPDTKEKQDAIINKLKQGIQAGIE